MRCCGRGHACQDAVVGWSPPEHRLPRDLYYRQEVSHRGCVLSAGAESSSPEPYFNLIPRRGRRGRPTRPGVLSTVPPFVYPPRPRAVSKIRTQTQNKDVQPSLLMALLAVPLVSVGLAQIAVLSGLCPALLRRPLAKDGSLGTEGSLDDPTEGCVVVLGPSPRRVMSWHLKRSREPTAPSQWPGPSDLGGGPAVRPPGGPPSAKAWPDLASHFHPSSRLKESPRSRCTGPGAAETWAPSDCDPSATRRVPPRNLLRKCSA
jgi:hypothetical protein